MQPRVQTSKFRPDTLPNWAAVQARLDAEHQSTLPGTDTTKAIRQFRLAWEAVREADLETRPTGLIEQQACFSILRGSTLTDPNG